MIEELNFGGAFTHIVRCRPLTTEIRVRTLAITYQICTGKVALGQEFLRALRFDCVSNVSPLLRIH